MSGSRFWVQRPLEKLSLGEWESLCDGCGRCCLHKFENKINGKVYYTAVACYLLDIQRCRCRAYAERSQRVNGCRPLTPRVIRRLRWLPRTCAYRLLVEGRRLPDWHPLVSNDPESVHRAGISVRNRAISEEWVHPDDLEAFILEDFG